MTDLLDVLEDMRLDLPAPCLFTGTARGYRRRSVAWEKWCGEYGNFDAVRRSHAWRPDYFQTLHFGTGHRPGTMSANLGCRHPGGTCLDVGDIVHRGVCGACDWEGPIRAYQAEAVEDAHDHSQPGWRDLPIVPRPPVHGTSKKERDAYDHWFVTVTEVYPDGWLEGGGPIVTARDPLATRDIPNGTRRGGYDLSARPFHEAVTA